MARSMHQSSLFVGLIIARSVEEPSAPDAIFYTVQVEGDTGVVEFEGVVPQPYYRNYEVEVDLVPFDIGMEVPVGVSRGGAEERYTILTGEKADMGECGDG